MSQRRIVFHSTKLSHATPPPTKAREIFLNVVGKSHASVIPPLFHRWGTPRKHQIDPTPEGRGGRADQNCHLEPKWHDKVATSCIQLCHSDNYVMSHTTKLSHATPPPTKAREIFLNVVGKSHASVIPPLFHRWGTPRKHQIDPLDDATTATSPACCSAALSVVL